MYSTLQARLLGFSVLAVVGIGLPLTVALPAITGAPAVRRATSNPANDNEFVPSRFTPKSAKQ